VDIARFGEKKLDLLRRFQPFRDGTPSHDHLGDIFATLDANLLRFLGGGADRRTGRCDRHRRQDELIKAHVFTAERIYGDDTAVPVLAKIKTRSGWLWTYVRDAQPFGGTDPPAAVFSIPPIGRVCTPSGISPGIVASCRPTVFRLQHALQRELDTARQVRTDLLIDKPLGVPHTIRREIYCACARIIVSVRRTTPTALSSCVRRCAH
jgi:hypothetical protein